MADLKRALGMTPQECPDCRPDFACDRHGREPEMNDTGMIARVLAVLTGLLVVCALALWPLLIERLVAP